MRRSGENTCPIFPSYFFLPDLDFSLVTAREEKLKKSQISEWQCVRRVLPLMDILACRSEENSYNILPSSATMLFHGLPGGDVHGVVEEMDRRGKSESAAISSAIDMGESETSMPCMNSERVALCAGCGRKIADRYYLLAVDKQWHMRCLKCCECKLNLESELTCFSKDGSIYCKEDYYRRFSVQRCARCHLGISASEMVMRARDLVYHLNCFTCTTCSKMLSTGDHFGMKDSLVYCRLHFETLIQGEYQTHFNHADVVPHKGLGPANTLGLSYFNGVGTVQKGRPRKRKSPGPGTELAAYNAALSCNENDGESMDRDSQYSSSQKTKRMRTSFKHHQLRTMKSYFAINHNPDAKDLKQLAQKTGLTKRVLQVWFQNARAKFRRNLLRQESGGVDKASDGSTLQGGTPSGPVSDISNASMSPSSTPTTLTDLTNPTMPTVTSVLTSVPGGMDGHECRSPSQTTLTSLF
ncbi:LIM/homeobox protein Lhx2b [Platichthys flesus]|uniref:LIM/homeobox protein Lhx2b n=1 Tax=Platichthys flesus TaxID=8260 RepID=UPI001A87DE2F|nr:LIM/homeobox protein Lhx2b [Platichthys flesus]